MTDEHFCALKVRAMNKRSNIHLSFGSPDDNDGIANWYGLFYVTRLCIVFLMDTRKSNEHNVQCLRWWHLLLWLIQSSRPTSRTLDRGTLSFANRIAIAEKLKMHTMGRNVCNYDLILVGRDTGAQDGTFVRHKCGHISFWLERFIWFWCDICFSHCRWLNQNRRTNSMKSRQKYCSTVQWISNGLTLHTMPSDIDG